MNQLKLKMFIVLIVIASLATFVAWPTKARIAQPPSVKKLFVYGFVSATVAQDNKTKDIALPNAKVFLVRLNNLNTPVASSLTDLSGRFALKTAQTGVFTLCAEAEGFTRGCSRKEFRLDQGAYKHSDTIRLQPRRSPDSATTYGEVTLRDGSHPRGFEPFMGVNAYGRVDLLVGSSTIYKGYINNLGEYIIPVVPVKQDFTLRVNVEKESLDRKIDKLTGLQAFRNYPIDIQLNNSAPKARLVSASVNGKPIQVASLGNTVTFKAVTEDRDADQLEYRWLLSDGKTFGPTTNSELQWTVPTSKGRFSATVLVSDNRGGYSRNTHTVLVSSGGIPFSGTVVNTNGEAVTGALIDVNGRLTNTNSKGWFSYEVPVQDKYVMTIRQSGIPAPNQKAYGTASFVYKGSLEGHRWVLRPAQIFTVNPKQPIKLQFKRDQKKCLGTQADKIDWTPYLNPGLIEWQDGKGNILSFGELGRRDPRSVQGVMGLLSRTNASLSRHLAKLTKVQAVVDDRSVPCRDGIQVEIPANALVHSVTKQAPSGNVRIALSAIDLTAPDQMPGDYTALDGNGKVVSMESFGAGSIEVTVGNARYNLKTGTTATVTIPVDGTQLAGNASLVPQIPFLYFDEQKGIWNQEGTATLTGSGATASYVMKVKHFSTMNADILKSGQSCVAVEVDPASNFTLPLNVEVTMPPSVVNSQVIQVRTMTVDSTKSNVIYNLPNNANIVLTPIISGVKPDGSTGNVPAGVFVVNTGGPQSSAVNPPLQNSDGSYYAESGTGPCGARVTLKQLNGAILSDDLEFLQGFSFQASNIDEFATTSQTIADNIVQGAKDYYKRVDPRELRKSFNLFKQSNKFSQPLNVGSAIGEVEYDAQYANSGDLGFGRDMHCRRNWSSTDPITGKVNYDIACYVTNYGQPPIFNPDQVDANNAHSKTNPDATVAMEFSRVENPSDLANPDAPNDPAVPISFPDNERAVKFYVYNTNTPDAAPLEKADLDGFGNRPVPQLCVICHGGQVASEAADITNPSGPKKGAFASRNDIMSMRSNFLPFDLHLFSYPTAKSKASQQAAFKNLNENIVNPVATEVAAGGGTGQAIVELISEWYLGGAANQNENAVITNWDKPNSSSDSHRFYRDVYARACRTCHIAQPFTAPVYTNKTDFQNDIGLVQSRVCTQKVMPHAKRTNDIFWTSLNPNMPAFLQLYGQTFPGWLSSGAANDPNQCGLFFQPGSTVLSPFANDIFPILTGIGNCTACHSTVGNANFVISGTATDTYNSLLSATAKDGVSKYIVPGNAGASLLLQRINTGSMPQGGPNLTTSAGGEALKIKNWIDSGAGN